MARKLIDTKKISHDEWLTLRKKSIGGSEAGALMGMNSYASPFTLYADKKGLSKPTETNEAMRLGTDLEEYVAKRFCEVTGKKVRRDNFMWLDDEFDFLSANVDREVVGENAGLECKTMGVFGKYDLDAGEVPSHYFCQCQHYMMVKGYDRMYLAILVLQKGFYWFTIERDDEFIAELRAAEVLFWTENIEKNVMPAPDGIENDLELLKELYPDSSQGEMDINEDENIRRYMDLGKAIKDMKGEQERIKAQICAQLGKHEIGVGYKYGCSWKTQSRKRFDEKTFAADHPELHDKYMGSTSYRVFRTKEYKKAK